MSALSVDEYLKLPYTLEITRDLESGGWVARVVELPGCITQAETFEQLDEMVQDAMRGWLEVALQDGLSIPEPRAKQAYSGKFVVRVPKSLHHRLVEKAEAEGVSLNQYINVVLASAVERRFDNPAIAMAAKEHLFSPEQSRHPGRERRPGLPGKPVEPEMDEV